MKKEVLVITMGVALCFMATACSNSNNITENTTQSQTSKFTTTSTQESSVQTQTTTVISTLAIPSTQKPTSATTVITTQQQTTQTQTTTIIITKPKLTDELQSQIAEAFIQAHSEELRDIESRHASILKRLNAALSDFDGTYLIKVRQINERYANMGLTNSGAHKAALQALEQQRSQYLQNIQAENDRYKNEKDAFIQKVTAEMQAYIEENYDIDPIS